MKRQVLDDAGQSTVEFALTLIMLMAFVLFFIQLSLVFAFGNYVHYATFMSARALLSSGPSPDDQQSRARDVIVRMLKRSQGQAGVDRFRSIGKGIGDGDPSGFTVEDAGQNPSRDSSWMNGVRYTFRSKVFILPLEGRGKASSPRDQANQVTLTSESWLGREASYSECQTYMSTLKGYFDNGC